MHADEYLRRSGHGGANHVQQQRQDQALFHRGVLHIVTECSTRSIYFVLDAKRFSMSNDNDKAKLPAQTLLQSGRNYSAWATRLRNKFEKEDVWEVVRPIAEGGQVAPGAAAAEEEVAHRQRHS